MVDQFGQVPEKNGNRGARNITQRTLGALFWAFSGTGAQTVLQVAVLVVLVRLLTPADFGLVGAALVVVNFSQIFSQVGVGPAVVQYAKLEVRHLRTGFTISAVFGLLLAGLIWLIAPSIADFFHMKELLPVLRALVLVFPLYGVSVIAESLLRRELQFSRLAGVEVASYAVGYGVIGVSLAFRGFGVWALVGACLAQTILRSITLLIVQPHPKRPQFERLAFKDLISFGGGFTLANLASYIALHGDNFIVGRWLGMEALGLYGRVYQLMAAQATSLGTVLEKVLFPAMSKVQNKPKLLAALYRRGTVLLALVVLPVSTASFVLAQELVSVLLGPQWSEAVVPFQIITLGMLFRSSYKLSGSVAWAMGAVYHGAWRYGSYAALVIGGAWVGQQWGLPGVALGVLGALAIHFIFMAQLCLSMVSMSWKEFCAAHLPAILLATITWGEVWVAATILRSLSAPPLVVLISSLGVTIPTLLTLLHLAPEFMLGRDGLWMARILVEYMPESFRLFRPLKSIQANYPVD